MTHSDSVAQLDHHQRSALKLIDRGAEAVAAGPEAVIGVMDSLRADLGRVLRDYQRFKHDAIFDPATVSPDPARRALASRMKIECIAAGETFRTHLTAWREEDVRDRWDSYKPAVRLTVNRLRRHILAERENLVRLIAWRDHPNRDAA